MRLCFPDDFLWGIATSAYQVEGGDTTSSWYRWEKKHLKSKKCKKSGERLIEDPCGIACDHWNRYKEDIQLIKKAGFNVYRFSVSWSKIEPRPGCFNPQALLHYRDVCQEAVRNGIKPVITLHHYNDPAWFLKIGGFKKEKNIRYFTSFCKKVAQYLDPYVYAWFTFNSPGGYAAKGYFLGEFPPGEKSISSMNRVHKNLLKAHEKTYYTLKSVNPTIPVGILKNIYQLDPYRPNNPLDKFTAHLFSYYSDGIFYTFFNNKKQTKKHKRRRKCLDFIGLNYYSHAYMRGFKRVLAEDEPATDNSNYRVYPHGIYRAIATISERIALPLDIPVYITENGIATDNDVMREQFMFTYLQEVSRAIKDGYPVKMYTHWSLLDNYEWGSYSKHYGIYSVDPTTQKRTLKPGAQDFVRFLQERNNASTKTPSSSSSCSFSSTTNNGESG